MMPFKSLHFDQMYLHQDNDPKHKSKLCVEALNNVKIKQVNNLLNIVIIFDSQLSFKIRSPPQSPDLNPIEMMWSEMKSFIKSRSCKTKIQIVNSIHLFSKQLTPQRCQANINKVKEVIQVVLSKDGAWSNYQNFFTYIIISYQSLVIL